MERLIGAYDYGTNSVVAKLAKDPASARLFMIADKRWKFMHAEGVGPQLFGMETDPTNVLLWEQVLTTSRLPP